MAWYERMKEDESDAETGGKRSVPALTPIRHAVSEMLNLCEVLPERELDAG